MNSLYKLVQTINATFWMPLIYIINRGYTIKQLPLWGFDIILMVIAIAISIILTEISISMTRFFGVGKDFSCEEVILADNEYLPVYLGYFFLAVSITQVRVLLVIYILIFVVTYSSQIPYFNPINLMFGYHYYYVITSRGSRVLVIVRGRVIRNKNDILFKNLRQLNDTTYIGKV